VAAAGDAEVDTEAAAAVGAEAEGAPQPSSQGQPRQQQQQKFLVFAHHKDVMDKLAEVLGGYSGARGPSASGAAAGDSEDEDTGQEGRGSKRGGSSSRSSGNSSSREHGWQGVGYVRVDGSHDSQERLEAVRRFKNDPSVRVALLSITAAGIGELQGWAYGVLGHDCWHVALDLMMLLFAIKHGAIRHAC
jgi:hypothetical protein